MAPFLGEDSSGSPADSGPQSSAVLSETGPLVPIAIVGMSCRCPGDATSPERLWQMCADGRSAWSKIPEHRFNARAFFHPQSEKPGASNVVGAHFLEEDISLFDASFFNLSTEVASSLDPQFRLQLESTFEALENAGISLKDAAGSRTAVFAGSFFHDYYDAMMRDPEALPRYSLTGNGSAMLSNRVSHFFNLQGPSVSVDTGCSTGITALHLACQSLRCRESNMAIVGGANILLNPDNFVAMSCLGFLGPDGKSYSFDDRAQGYGRGEGVATIVIKRLDDALRDNDSVRAIIRATALNQDGKTPTITSPSQAAQEELIRRVYRDHKLQPKDTSYVEAHGTGTKAGDPIESRAIGSVFGEGRSPQNPLYVASLKTNIGHLEAASGVAAVIKVAMALGKGFIPPSANFIKPNPDIDLDTLKLQIPKQMQPWPAGRVRRASLSNFGYGGANAHVIMEAFPQSINPKTRTLNGTVNLLNGKHNSRRHVFVISAKDDGATKAATADLKGYLQRSEGKDNPAFIKNLAYTLGQRRTHFPWVVAASAKDQVGLIRALDSGNTNPSYSSKAPRIGFVFNGQGAQWHAMGRELISMYPVFRDCLQEADGIIKKFGASWSLMEELLREPKSTRVNYSEMSLPLCTALQLALVRLLDQWGIKPTAVTGHSSGEAAAAFTAGALDFNEALATSYFRGLLTARFQEKLQQKGRMLAVGLGPKEISSYLSNVTQGKVVLACVNSSSSVTISGDEAGIEELAGMLAEKDHFARKLKVDVAYHSHHMEPQKKEYLKVLEEHLKRQHALNDVHYSSPVTGATIHSAKQLGPQNWVNNMVQPVLFAQSLKNMCSSTSPESPDSEKLVDIIIEIGPHSALAGPIRQILSEPSLKRHKILYGSCLERAVDATETTQSLVCLLLRNGYPVDLAKVNFPANDSELQVLGDLPSYPWNHSVSYWTESRLNKDHRHRMHPTHDLLGSRLIGGNPSNPTWRHFLRPSELPWMRDHVIQNKVVYPAAGYITMAIEAMRQLCLSHERVSGYSLKDIAIQSALVIPDTPEGVEIQISIIAENQDLRDPQNHSTFRIHSIDSEGNWSQHCSGSICAQRKSSNNASLWHGTVPDDLILDDMATGFQATGPEKLFSAFKSIGIEYGPLFKNVKVLRCGPGRALATISIPNVIETMPSHFQQNHLIHPATLDAALQTSYGCILATSNLDSAMVPTFIKSLEVTHNLGNDVGHQYQAFADLKSCSSGGFEASIFVRDESNANAMPSLTIEGLSCTSIGKVLIDDTDSLSRKLCSAVHWCPTLSLSPIEDLQRTMQSKDDDSHLLLISDLKRAAYYLIHDAVNSLTTADVQKMKPHHQKMCSWMRHQIDRAAQNQLDARSCKWSKASEGVKEMLFDKVSTNSVDGQMVCRIGKNLTSILRGQSMPLELMLEDKLLHQYYERTFRAHSMHKHISRMAKLFANENPNAKILEIGGGTGGYTQPILDAYGEACSDGHPTFARYDFTDVSVGFFEAAKEKFSSFGDKMHYRRLDIEASPLDQGFEAGSYDLVYACQVLHATKSMKGTMTNVRKLLKPGGKLILVETTRDSLEVFLVFATLPGWWLSEEEERMSSPSLTPDMWSRVLTSTGFSGLDLDVHDFSDHEKYSHSLILSTAVADICPAPGVDTTVIWASDPPPDEWMKQLQKSLELSCGSCISFVGIDEADTNGETCIFLDEVGGSILSEQSAARFHAVKEMLTTAKRILWVSFGGASDCPSPEHGLVAGLLRTLRLENRTKVYVSLDLEPTPSPFSSAALDAIDRVYKKAMVPNVQNGLAEFEYVQRDSQICIPRYIESPLDNEIISSTTTEKTVEPQSFRLGPREIYMTVKTPGLLDSLYFKETPSLPHSDVLPEGMIEVETKAFGLNFRDIMVAMGQLDSSTMGFECSGVVTRLGPASKHNIKLGDRVCALTQGDWATFNRVHWTNVTPIPNGMSFEEAASIPVVYVTAYYSLYELARLQAGESILIHAAAGGVGQASIALAQIIGAEIFATVGSEEKRNFLVDTFGLRPDHIFYSRDSSFAKGVMAATKGRGVDVIINSLSGRLLRETWNCIAIFGRFVEIGKRDLEQNSSLNMSPFTRAASFFAVDLLHLEREKGLLVQSMLCSVMELLKSKQIRPISPTTSYPISNVNKAFRVMQSGKHTGKIVITASSDDIVNVLPHSHPLRFEPEASYLIVGGLGGIGRSFAQWFVDHGARYLMLLSRSAESQRSEFRELIDSLSEAGCKVTLCSCDISNKDDLSRALQQYQSCMPPIRGVIQGAMVLQDSVFDHMTFEKWQAAVRPKVQGTINLHTELLHQPLDFFILLSSLIGISGHVSQANYAAGATFQDAFARYRAGQGLPAISIDLGWVKSVGYVAETKGVAERMARMGYTQLEQDKVLLILESAIKHPKRTPQGSQVVTGIGPLSTTKDFDLPWRLESRFATWSEDMVGEASKDHAGEGAKETKILKSSLKNALTWPEAINLIVSAMVAKLSDMFSRPEAEIDPTLAMPEYGVDSLVAVELRNWLFAEAGAEMSTFDILQSKSLTILAEKVGEKSAFVKEAGLSNGRKQSSVNKI